MTDMNRKNSVLVIDDDRNSFEVIEALLYKENYDFTYIYSGKEALTLLGSINPDVILLDVMMPELDGIEVCRLIKSNPTWKHIPIIMVTALNSKEDLGRCFEAGADDFLDKPISGIELRARVRSMMRIKQQYDSLQETLQLREDLSNMVVHDLRNPVTNIILSSQLLLLQNQFEGKNLERVNLIQASARQLNEQINDLLVLAKMESGKLVLNLVEVDLNHLVKDAIDHFNEIAGSKKLNLITYVPEQGKIVAVDDNLLHRVLDNLLSNAIKFSPSKSTITLQVEYPSDESPNVSYCRQAIIRISDCGPGISPENKQQIFDKYEVGKLISGASQIGLGLTFCKMVTEAHGGRILVEDNQPKGSIFIVEI